MLLIDRYLVSTFIRVFVICFISLLGMYVVADFVNNLNELLEQGQQQGGLGRVLWSYYGPQFPWFFDLIGRVVALIAVVFATTWLQRNNEMAALMAAGISRWRIVRPLIISAAVVSVLAALNRELLLPQLRHELGREAKNLSGARLEQLHPRFDHATDIFFDGKGTIAKDQQIENPKFRLPPTLSEFGYSLQAESAAALPADANHPAGYLLQKVRDNGKTTLPPTAALNGKPVIFSPSDTVWLEADQVFIASEIPFALLQGGNEWRQFASTPELIAGLWNPSLEYGADVRVTVHARILQPVLDVLLIFLGLPLVLTKESRNVFVSAGSCLAMVAIFMVTMLACHGMGMNYLLSPAFATWCPVLIFVPLAMALSEPLRR